ncbi:MAG: macro domain-containing protein [Candidatus Heimdallarchaeota archaeon]
MRTQIGATKLNIELRKGDITQQDVDAIVNAANTRLIMGGGVAGAIRRAGGEEINEEAINKGPIPLGEAAVTNAGRLKAKYVIHAASMHLGGVATAESIKKSVRNSLLRAEELGLKTIAFPAVGCGIAGFPVSKGAEIILQTISEFEPRSLEQAIIILFSQADYEIFENTMKRLSH